MPLAPPTNRMHRSFGRRLPPPKPPRFAALRLAGRHAVAAARLARRATRGMAARARDLARRAWQVLERKAPQARAVAETAWRTLRGFANAARHGLASAASSLAAACRRLAATAVTGSRRLLARARAAGSRMIGALRRGLGILAALDLATHLRHGAAVLSGVAVVALLGALFMMAGQDGRTAPRAVAVAIAPASLPEVPGAIEPVPVTVPPRPVALTHATPPAAPSVAAGSSALAYVPPVPRLRPEPPLRHEEHRAPAEADDRPRIAIVIDDLGLDRAATERLAAIEGPLTLAFLPYASGLAGQTARVREAGHELLVHLPMAPRGGVADPGPMALAAGTGEAELRRRIAWNLSRFEGYVGINNHMGSGLTADPAAMGILMRELAARGHLFLDSRTTPETVAQRAAERAGIPNAGRDVFLDNEQDARAVERQFDKLEAIARRRGAAIGIGHPHDETLEALERRIPEARARGFVLVPVSALARQPAATRVAASGAAATGGR